MKLSEREHLNEIINHADTIIFLVKVPGENGATTGGIGTFVDGRYEDVRHLLEFLVARYPVFEPFFSQEFVEDARIREIESNHDERAEG